MAMAVLVCLLSFGTARAIDAPVDNQAIVTPFVYNEVCAPISDKLMDKVRFYGRMLTDQEAMRALYSVNLEVGAMGKVNWCAALKPTIDQVQ